MISGGYDSDRKENITDIQLCDQLDDLEATGQIIAAGEKMEASVDKIDEVLQIANLDAAAYSDALKSFSNGISLDDNEEAAALIAQMIQQTQEMQQQNQKLRAQLEESSVEVKALHGNLETVRREATTDELTKVGNRKYFDLKLREAAEKAKSNGETVSLLLFDVDHFKFFNDTHGHQTGDQVLRLVARALKEGVKGRDVVARYGGEEFAVILLGADLQNAVKVRCVIALYLRSRGRNSIRSGQIPFSVTCQPMILVSCYRPFDRFWSPKVSSYSIFVRADRPMMKSVKSFAYQVEEMRALCEAEGYSFELLHDWVYTTHQMARVVAV